jgi:hypothetical protein
VNTTNNFYNEAHAVIEIDACGPEAHDGKEPLRGIALVAIWVGFLVGSWAAVGLLVYLAFRAI